MPGGSSRIKRSDDVYRSNGSSSMRGSNSRETDFTKYISIDLSSFESRFEQIFDKLDELEARIALVPPGERALSEPAKNLALDGGTRSTPYTTASETADANAATVSGNNADEPPAAAAAVALHPSSLGGANSGDLAKEIESLRAAQLRLQINQEVEHSTLRVDVETLRRDLELMPRRHDLQNFRVELDVALANTVQTMHTEQARAAQNLNVTLSEPRIQDLWSGMHSTTRKLNESIQFIQIDLIKQEEIAKDVTNATKLLRKTTSTLERDTRAHETTLGDHDRGIAQAFTLLAQTDAKLVAQEGATAGHVMALTARIEQIENRLNTTQQRHDAFAHEVDTTLKNVCSDVVSCQSTLQAHQESLHAFDTGMLRQGAELMRVNDVLLRQEAKLGGLDGRVAMSEKKTATLASVLQEQHHEMQQNVHTLTTALDHAASDRAAMKQTQQRVSEVAKLATTTDLGLTRTASEIPKLHALVTNASANVAKNRQTLRDLTVMLDEERATAQSLQTQLDAEVALSVTRFTDVAARDDATQQAILDANATTQHTKHSLEDAIWYNGNLIHQLNTMVDSIAITESADGMEDKLAKFALSVAELGLKMEHFIGGNSSNSSNHGGGSGATDVKTELAVLLTKVIRFLGSGVAIDQNKYLLTVKRAQSVAEDGSGAIVVEASPQHVLEGFRVAKAALFCNKTRVYMDQLAPVLATNKYTVAFRDHFERKLKFILEFGLANLFPNTGKPRHAHNARGNVGTCIACDRPIDDEQLEQRQDGDDEGAVTGSRVRGSPEHDIQQYADETAAEEHRLRRQRIVANATTSKTSNRVDTTSVIRGRSGENAGLGRPKSSAEPIHQAPGTADFIYRTGFRLPRPSSSPSQQQQNSLSKSSSSSASLLFAGALANAMAVSTCSQQESPVEDNSASEKHLFDEGSSLEKVALAGKCQAVEIPSATLSHKLRPHTAPYRTKSLPRLEGVGAQQAGDVKS